jgi:hypothetical protein
MWIVSQRGILLPSGYNPNIRAKLGPTGCAGSRIHTSGIKLMIFSRIIRQARSYRIRSLGIYIQAGYIAWHDVYSVYNASVLLKFPPLP